MVCSDREIGAKFQINAKIMMMHPTKVPTRVEENEALPKKQRRRMTRIWKELTNDGYDGGYDSVRRYAKKWRIAHGKQQAKAFIPLIFDPGEAYQFDWSEEKVVMAGEFTIVKVAHFKLSHSRMPFSIAYPRETRDYSDTLSVQSIISEQQS